MVQGSGLPPAFARCQQGSQIEIGCRKYSTVDPLSVSLPKCKLTVAWSPFASTGATNFHNFDCFRCHYWCLSCSSMHSYGRSGLMSLVCSATNFHNFDCFRCHYWRLSCSSMRSYGRSGLMSLVCSVCTLADQLQATGVPGADTAYLWA